MDENKLPENIDELYPDAGFFIIQKGRASIGMIQRWFNIGFNRAARIIDQLAETGVVGPEDGMKPREVLMNKEQFETFLHDENIPALIAANGTNYEIERLKEKLKEKVEQIIEDSDENVVEKTEILAKAKMPEREILFLPENSQNIIRTGNCIVEKCDYDDPIDFCEIVLTQCSPLDLRLLLVDTEIQIFDIFRGFPALFIPPVTESKKFLSLLNWIDHELQSRRELQIKSGYRDYSAYNNSLPPEKKKTPILVIVREIAGLLHDNEIYDELRKLLPICAHFEIVFILFSQYKLLDVKLGSLNDVLSQKSVEWILNIFNTASAIEEAERNIKIDEMSGCVFEQFCAAILEKSGFTNVRLTKASGDMGGDVLAEKEQVKYVVQCKRYESSVGISAVQEVIGSRSIYNCHVGVVLTSNYFTKQAVNLAEKNNILLWDRDELMRRMDKVNLSG